MSKVSLNKGLMSNGESGQGTGNYSTRNECLGNSMTTLEIVIAVILYTYLCMVLVAITSDSTMLAAILAFLTASLLLWCFYTHETVAAQLDGGRL